MPIYENSVIYKIKHNEDYDDTNIYVGSTSNFKNRKYQHKTDCNNEKHKIYNLQVYQIIRDNGGWYNWVMIPIEEYPCNSKKELEIRERYHIDILRPTLNKNIPNRTQKEYQNANKEKIQEYFKKYRENNKERIIERDKKYRNDNKEKKQQYRIANKEKIAETDKKKYEANKEKIAERAKEKVICEYCGCEFNKSSLKKHQKTKKCLKLQEDNVAW